MFPALVEYMDSRDALRRLNNFTVRAVRTNTSSYQSLQDELQQGGRPATVFSPGEGFHLFRHGRPAHVDEARDPGRQLDHREDQLSTLGRDTGPLQKLVGAAMDHRIARELNRIAIYVPSPYSNEWSRARLATTASSTRSC